MRVLIATAFLALFACVPTYANIVYANDFDGGVQTGAGTTVSISGGTGIGQGIMGGITSTQGYNAFSDFGGDFWRVTAGNDVLQFSPVSYTHLTLPTKA